MKVLSNKAYQQTIESAAENGRQVGFMAGFKAGEKREREKANSAFPEVNYPDPDWTQDHVSAWRSFLASDVGKTLRAIANYREQAANRIAVLTDGDHAKNAGFAVGWQRATEYFFNQLSSLQSREHEGLDAGEATDAERLRERLAS